MAGLVAPSFTFAALESFTASIVGDDPFLDEDGIMGLALPGLSQLGTVSLSSYA